MRVRKIKRVSGGNTKHRGAPKGIQGAAKNCK